MLSPDYLLKISDGAESIAARMHTEILKKIITRIMQREAKGYNYLLTAQDKWAIQNLEEAGYLLSDIQQEIATYTGYQADEIKQAMEDAGVTALKYDDKTYEQAGMSPPPLQQSPYMVRVMQRGYESTMGTWKNFTRTTANASENLFINTLDKIYTQVQGGAVSYTKAYMDAIDEICEDGVVITYPSGHVDTVETATLRCVRTGITQTTAEIEIARMEEIGWDLIIVSSHQGARPSHQVWQGKIYSRSGKSDKYPDFVSSTHYGEGNGLCGWNCRHHFGPYLEGNENPYKDYSNKENIELYEKTQQQRALERAVRKSARKMETYKAALDGCQDDEMRGYLEKRYKDARAEVRAGRQEYKAFCEQEGFRPLPERMRIAKEGKLGEKYSGPDILEVKPPRRETPIEPKGQTEGQLPETPPVVYKPTKEFLPYYPEENKQVTEEYAKLVNGCGNSDLIELFSMYGDKFTYVQGSGKYEPGDRKVNWHINTIDKTKYATLAHEMGHGVDFMINKNIPNIKGRRSAIMKAMSMVSDPDSRRYGPSRRPSQSDAFVDAIMEDIKHLKETGLAQEDYDLISSTKTETDGFEDFLDAVFDSRTYGTTALNIPKTSFGHGWEYWERAYDAFSQIGESDNLLKALQECGVQVADKEGMRELLRTYENASETWANITEAIINNSVSSHNLDLFKKYCPKSYQAYLDLNRQHLEQIKSQPAAGAKKLSGATKNEPKEEHVSSSEAEKKKELPPLLSMTSERRRNRTRYDPDEHLYHTSDLFGPMSAEDMKSLVERCGNRDTIELYNLWGDVPTYVYNRDEQRNYYMPVTDTVKWTYDGLDSNQYSALAHETGHAFDFHMDSIGSDDYSLGHMINKASGQKWAFAERPSQSDGFLEAVLKDIAALEKNGIEKADISLINSHNNTDGFEDFLDGAFGARDKRISWLPDVYFGHGKEYYERGWDTLVKEKKVDKVLKALKRSGKEYTQEELRQQMRAFECASELWANLNMAITTSSYAPEDGKSQLELFEKYCPNAVKEYKKRVKAHLKTMEGREKPTREKNKLWQTDEAKNLGGITLNAATKKKEPSELETYRKAREQNRKKFRPDDDFLPAERGVVNKRDANKRFRDMITNCGEPDIIELFNMWADLPEYNYLGPSQHVKGEPGAAYHPDTRTIDFRYDDKVDNASIFDTIAHEMGHAFDDISGRWGTKRYSIMEAINDSLFGPEETKIRHTPSQSDYFMGAMFEDINRIIANGLDKDVVKKIGTHYNTHGFEDFLDGAFGQRTNKYKWLPETIFGHGEDYYNRRFDGLRSLKSTVLFTLRTKHGIDLGSEEKLAETLRGYETASELWAHLTCAFAVAAEDGGETKALFEKCCPSSVAAFKKLIHEHLEAVAAEQEEAAKKRDARRGNK